VARRPSALLAALVALLLAAPAGANRAEHRPVAAPPEMDYVPPAAGSYRLQVIQQAPDGQVVGRDGLQHRLSDYTRGRITLLSLIYTYCSEPTGCALAYGRRGGVRACRGQAPARARSSSACRSTRSTTPTTRVAWRRRQRRRAAVALLTTRSMRPCSRSSTVGQDIEVERDAQGRATRTITHMLKLFLIDRRGRVREIYTTEFLHPEAMLNDIRTLVMEEDAQR
jgi:cytochrome oxidase Cu insertion factor (SCO1/SenC/PrrC family)